MIKEEFLKLNATHVTNVTLVGYLIKEFPSPRGNCFGMMAEDGEKYRIVNFNYENLEKLIKDKLIDFPILIHKLRDGFGVIADPRIPDDWYSTRFCESCTPRDLLPYPQKLRIELQILRGDRKERVIEIDGKKIIATTINIKPQIRERR
jgi:hypothetical protein